MKRYFYPIRFIGCFFSFFILSFLLFQSVAYPAPSSYYDTVQKIYIGYYQRPADPAGLIYWAERLDGSNGDLNEIIEAFARSEESQALYGTINNDNIAGVVNDVYNALFGRDAESSGQEWYVNEFKAGRFTAATIMLNVLYGAQGTDLQCLNNKLTASNLFTKVIDPELDGANYQVTYVGDSDAVAARNFLTLYATSSQVPTQAVTKEYILANIADTGDAIFSTSTMVSETVEADQGGTITLDNGASVTIAANALDKDTVVSVGSVDISQFDGDAAAHGGVNGLHVAGTVFGPDGTVLNTPAVLRLPLPSDWVNDKTLELYAGTGTDVLDALPTGERVNVVGTPGSYFAEVELSHFSNYLVSYNCHSGTYRNIVKAFEERGCTEQEIRQIVEDLYDGFSIDDKQAENMSSKPIQAFLGTFFYQIIPYNEDEPVSDGTILELKEYIKKGRQVVIAFHTKQEWPDKDPNDHYFYDFISHTANLEIDEAGIVQMRNTLEYNPNQDGKRYGGLLSEDKMGPTLSYTYPLDDIKTFRTLQNGTAFRDYVLKQYPGTMQKEQFIISKEKLGSVVIYVERSRGSAENACTYAANNPKPVYCSEKGSALATVPVNGVLNDGTHAICTYHTSNGGNLNSEIIIINHKASGIWKQYYSSGQIYKITPYKDGNLNGLYRVYYETGQPRREIQYTDDKRNGYDKEYDNSGLISCYIYENDVKKGSCMP